MHLIEDAIFVSILSVVSFRFSALLKLCTSCILLTFLKYSILSYFCIFNVVHDECTIILTI